MKKKTQLIVGIFFVSICFFFSNDVFAADFYVSLGGIKTDGASIEGDWSNANCYGNLQAAIGQMAANDKIIVNDGIYTGTNNTVRQGINTIFPSGAGSGYTTIMARNVGQAVFDGEGVRNIITIAGTKTRIHLDGLVFKNGCLDAQTNYGNLVGFQGTDTNNRTISYIKVTRCGFNETTDVTLQANRTNMFYTRFAHHILLEDNYMWGHIGRYGHYFLDSDHVVVRRSVVRADRTTQEADVDNAAAYRSYSSDFVTYQNCLMVDSDLPDQQLTGDPGVPSQGAPWMFFIDGDVDDGIPDCNNTITGSIGVNNQASGIWFNNDDDVYNNNLQNSVFYNFRDGVRTRDADETLTVNHVNFVNISNANSSLDRMFTDFSAMMTVSNSVLFGFAGSGALANVRGMPNDYRSLYNNTANYDLGATVGLHDITNQNPLTSAILYPPRIEEGSYLKGAGEGGSDIGGEVLYKIGTDGTFYGDPGYDTATVESLWPWPYESIIKSHMSSYNLHGINGARGFATGTSIDGSSQTLTKYIWEYLGNQIPCEIYDTCGGDTTAPNEPSGLSVS